MAYKYNLTGQRIGKLTIIRKLEVEERPTQTHGNYWLCKCDCGNYVKVPTTYLTGNSNYTQTSCGCERKKRAFCATSDINLPEEYFEKFQIDFEKFLIIHKAIVKTSGNNASYYNLHLDEYKQIIEFFWDDKQFNAVYDFWNKNKNKNNTFYDWAKPSLDHIIPTSKNGKNILDNFQFLTTFENLAKRDMSMDEWIEFQKNTNTHSDYFINSIMKERAG